MSTLTKSENHHQKEEVATTNRTFRLESSASHLLEQEALDRNISANSVINELIQKDLMRERGFRAVRMIHVPALAIGLLTRDIPEELVIEAAQKAASDALLKDVQVEVGGSMSSESVLKIIKLLYDCSESEYDGKGKVIVAHYAGRKWSLFLGTLWKSLFASSGKNANFSVDDNAVIFEFEK